MTHDPVVIVSAKRTPMGGLLGDLSSIAATALGSHAIKAATYDISDKMDMIDEAYMGCVLSAGLGQAPARQAVLGAGLQQKTPCTTVSKVCGSGLKSVMLAHDAILAGSNHIVLAGGMESMSGAPHILRKARSGYRLGEAAMQDHMFLDGLEDAYDKGKLMGVFAEQCAQSYQFTRDAQDAFAITSLERAQKAAQSGYFNHEIEAVTYSTKKGEVTIDSDELPRKADKQKIPTLKPAFAKDGTVTAANASSISDGAAALLLMRLSQAEKLVLTPLAKILGHSSHAQSPDSFATAPIPALQKLSDKTGLALKNVDLFEINEAFAVVTMAAMRDLDLPHDKVNIHGGACALGHPIGASGARILVTLLHALHTHDQTYGMASLCIGGGEAVAVAIERI